MSIEIHYGLKLLPKHEPSKEEIEELEVIKKAHSEGKPIEFRMRRWAVCDWRPVWNKGLKTFDLTEVEYRLSKS